MNKISEIFSLLDEVEDPRQVHKVKHSIADVLLLVLFAKLGNIKFWEEIEDFGLHYETELKKIRQIRKRNPFHGKKRTNYEKFKISMGKPCGETKAKHKNRCTLSPPSPKQTASVLVKFKPIRKAMESPPFPN